MVDRGLLDLMSGAVSERSGAEFFITRLGALMSDLMADDIITCPIDGPIDEASAKPALDAIAIQAAYQANPNLSVIVRVHPPHALAMASTSTHLEIPDNEGRMLFGPRVPVQVMLQDQLIADIHEKLPLLLEEKTKVILVRGYGLYAAGETLREAIRAAAVLETSAKIQWLIRSSSAASRPPMSQGAGPGGPRRDSPGGGQGYRPSAPQNRGSMGTGSKPHGFPKRDFRSPRRFNPGGGSPSGNR
jgi:ribulose-5-phosphate 4-epimerase/fuculose-1-phosphate aldolase